MMPSRWTDLVRPDLSEHGPVMKRLMKVGQPEGSVMTTRRSGRGLALRARFTRLKAHFTELRAQFTKLRAKSTELKAPAMLLLALVSSNATAQQFDQVGSNQIHYTAIETTFIAEEVATRFGLERRPGLGMVTVSVLDANGDSRNVAVDGSVADLNGRQPRPLAFRRLREASGGISSIATFPIDYAAPMRFQLDIQLDRNTSPHPVSFIQRFYRDE